ncbi:hypothetical protein ACN47E_004214 [Coniothyrium glycines]
MGETNSKPRRLHPSKAKIKTIAAAREPMLRNMAHRTNKKAVPRPYLPRVEVDHELPKASNSIASTSDKITKVEPRFPGYADMSDNFVHVPAHPIIGDIDEKRNIVQGKRKRAPSATAAATTSPTKATLSTITAVARMVGQQPISVSDRASNIATTSRDNQHTTATYDSAADINTPALMGKGIVGLIEHSIDIAEQFTIFLRAYHTWEDEVETVEGQVDELLQTTLKKRFATAGERRGNVKKARKGPWSGQS